MKNNQKINQEDLDKVRPQIVIAIMVLIFVTGFILLYPFAKKLVPQVNLDQPQEQTVQTQTLAQKLADEPRSNGAETVTFTMRPRLASGPVTNSTNQISVNR